MTKEDKIRAVGLQVDIERITASIAESQSAAARHVKEQKSFGYWTARRCDVYVASFQQGLLHERVELTKELWGSHIRTDLMYEEATQGPARHCSTSVSKVGFSMAAATRSLSFSCLLTNKE